MFFCPSIRERGRSGSKQEFIRQIKKLGYQIRWEDARRSITYTHPNGIKAKDIK